VGGVRSLLDSRLAKVETSVSAMEERVETGLSGMEKLLQETSERLRSGAETLAKTLREETGEAETRLREEGRKRLEEWKDAAENAHHRGAALLKDLQEAASATEARLRSETGALQTDLDDFSGRTREALGELEKLLRETAAEAHEKAMASVEETLVEYRTALRDDIQRFESMGEDTRQLEEELLRYMRETEDRVREDFARFDQESAAARQRVSGEFAGALETLRQDMAALEAEVGALKTGTYENMSEKMRLFEDDFFKDLTRRGNEIEQRLRQWRESLEAGLGALGAQAREERLKAEQELTEGIRKRLTEQEERLTGELAEIKAKAAAFQEGLRGQLARGDEAIAEVRTDLERSLANFRQSAEAALKAELGRQADTVGAALREEKTRIEGTVKEIASQFDARKGEVAQAFDAFKGDIESWEGRCADRLADLEAAVEESRRKARELAAENEERQKALLKELAAAQEEAAGRRTEYFERTGEQVKSLEASIKAAQDQIREFASQTRLFEQAESLKLALETRMREIQADMESLEERKGEIAAMEEQALRAKRIEEETGAKLNRFMLEKRRIDLMEEDFNRLLATSQGVQEKLAQATASEDLVQALQLRLRDLQDLLTETEERYERIERKGKTLESTNEGIDRNFKALQEAEASIRECQKTLGLLSREQDALAASVRSLAGESQKVRETAEKAENLDAVLKDIEERAEKMNQAREWYARLEGRFEELLKKTREQLKAMDNLSMRGALLKAGAGVKPGADGAPPIGVREQAISLHRTGWKAEEIARNLGMSIGEVELILELPRGD